MENAKQPHILILSHGFSGQEMLRSAEMIMGEIENVDFVPLTNQTTVEEYRKCVREKIENLPEGSIVLTDLYGGTPCNTAALLSREYTVNLIAGFNLPLLIECVSLRNEFQGRELCEEAVANVRDSILTVQIGERGA